MLDSDLLQKYAQQHCEDSFRELVTRHGPLVSATAYRQLDNVQLAEEVTQNVFTALATKASRLPRHPSLAGWLYRATQLECGMTKRREHRRLRREAKAAQQAMVTPSLPDMDAMPMAAALDDAILTLSGQDQSMIFARFYDGLSIRELAEKANVGEKAAQKRVERAVSRLRKAMGTAGVTLPMSSLQAQLVIGAQPTQWTSICQRALEVSTSKTASLGLINVPIVLGVTTLVLTSIAVWFYLADPMLAEPSELGAKNQLQARSPTPEMRIDDLDAIYRLAPTEREEALVRLVEYLETRREQDYFVSLFERWSVLDAKRSLISLVQLGDLRDYLFSQIVSETLIAWLERDSQEALDWMEGYDRGRQTYECDLGDALIGAVAQWIVADELEQAIVWLLDRRVLTTATYEHMANALRSHGWKESLRLLGGIPEDAEREISFAIDNSAGEVNLGHLIPAAAGNRTEVADESLVYQIHQGARKGLLVESLLREWLDEAKLEPLADQALTLPSKARGDDLLGNILRRWAKEDTDGAVDWYLNSLGMQAGRRLQSSARGLLAGLPKKDIEAVWRIWTGHGDDISSPVLGVVASHLAQYQLTESMLDRFILIDDPDQRARGLQLCGNALYIGNRSCEQAARAISALPMSPQDRQEVVMSVAGTSINYDMSYQAWASWLVENSGQAYVESNLGQFVGQWAPRQPNDVAAWLNGLEGSSIRDAAVESFVRVVWLREKDTALSWIDEIASRERREALLAELTQTEARVY